MRIGHILHKSLIIPHLSGTDKESVLGEMATHLCQTYSENSAELPDDAGVLSLTPEFVRQALISRERLGSTGVGEGVAIPHAKIPGLNSLVATFGRKPEGVAFESIDKQPVRLIFVLLVPEHSAGTHLKALARISRLLKDASFRDRLLSLETTEELHTAFVEEDAKY